MKLANLFNPPLPHQYAKVLTWGGLPGSAAALAITNIAKHHPEPIIILTESTQSANWLETSLRFFAKGDEAIPEVFHFPDWEILPYDQFSPHQDIVSERLLILNHLTAGSRGIFIVAVATTMHQLPPENYLLSYSLALKRGQQLDLKQFRTRLQNNGYRLVPQVMEHGEYAIRGSIIDLFPMGSELPCRIDLFDEEIDSIRYFDPENQRSIKKVATIDLLPAHEFPLDEASITLFRQNWRKKFTGNPAFCPIYQQISEGIAAAGVDYYLPLFFNRTMKLFDYLPDTSLMIRLGNCQHAAEQFWAEIKHRHEQLGYDISRPLLAPQEMFIQPVEIFAACKQFQQIKLQAAPVAPKAHHINFASLIPPELPIDRKAKHPLHQLTDYLNKTEARILFCAESLGRKEILLALFQQNNIKPLPFDSWHAFINSQESLGIVSGLLEQGLCLTDPKIELIVESQLYGTQVMQRRRRQAQVTDINAIIRDLTELQLGSPIVHLQHGIGRYSGLQTLQINEYPTEFLVLNYADDDKIYVPVTSLHLISRYTGVDNEHIQLNKLGSSQWSKVKAKTSKQIHDIAAQLLDLYAQRKARKGFKYQIPQALYRTLIAAFPFEETPDQQRAIEAVIQDMASELPMDRLICGDVGFGKTEVAMRAAFLAIQNDKQVALLVPTTLLAEQHYKNFSDRFAEFAINIEILSRFRTRGEQEQVLRDLKSGQTDLVIGTHKLIQKGVQFKDLGLIVIDEEHRFGVKQKEHLKTLRTQADVLSLTATPIPRTLNMTLSGLQDISLIMTPPAKRLSIKTFVQQKNNAIIRDAILREIMRGGQVFYLHNTVQTIQHAAQELKDLLPEAKIAIAHGQMRERELEQIMIDFYHQRYQVLVCSTIIENGIDIPTANTIIINRADHFGLGQLHQLRGRVGRSHHQAYAYLLAPDEKNITRDAKKRLEAIVSLEDLGAGFNLATHDLEIRGCGELLGEEQSGNIQAIGFNLYMELLERAVQTFKSAENPDLAQPLAQPTEIDLHLSAIIPETYLPDVHTRLILYKRIANAQTVDTLNELQVEMVDRFGILPLVTKYLFQVTQLKLLAQGLGIKRVDAHPTGGYFEFESKPNLDPQKVLHLVQSKPQEFQFAGSTRLRFIHKTTTPQERISWIDTLLQTLN